MNISNQQIVAAASAGVNLLSRDSTLVPGSLRRQVDLLDVLLQGVSRGTLVIQEPVLESDDTEKEETPCE